MSALIEPLVVSLVERGWTGFFFASGVAFFGAVAAGFGVLANATCTTAMYLALFGESHLLKLPDLYSLESLLAGYALD
jgi:hypothetical protein